MVDVGWRGLWCVYVCGWQDLGMAIRESSVVSFLPCSVTFLRFHPTCSSIFSDFSETLMYIQQLELSRQVLASFP